jgi:hypothetical protein
MRRHDIGSNGHRVHLTALPEGAEKEGVNEIVKSGAAGSGYVGTDNKLGSVPPRAMGMRSHELDA